MTTTKTITTYVSIEDDEIEVDVCAKIYSGNDAEDDSDDVTLIKVLRTDNKHDILSRLSDTEIESLKQEVYDAYTSF